MDVQHENTQAKVKGLFRRLIGDGAGQSQADNAMVLIDLLEEVMNESSHHLEYDYEKGCVWFD